MSPSATGVCSIRHDTGASGETNVIHIPQRIAPFRLARFILMASALSLAGVAAAALKDKPPEGVTLSGTWKLDPRRSDDPVAEMRRAENGAQDRTERDRSDTRMPGQVDDDDPLGRDFPDRRTRPGGWTHDDGKTSTGIDPWGGTQSATITLGSSGYNLFRDQLNKNPQELDFALGEQHVKVTADRLETECTAGAKIPISDSYGDGERRCGWNGRALVIETKRGTYFSRTDRYELSKDGKTLKYVTTASGKSMPNVRISRTYVMAPPAG
jgi:hypothetical protein